MTQISCRNVQYKYNLLKFIFYLILATNIIIEFELAIKKIKNEKKYGCSFWYEQFKDDTHPLPKRTEYIYIKYYS